MEDAKNKAAINALNHIMELELAGVVKYTHYSLIVYSYNRIQIVAWKKAMPRRAWSMLTEPENW